METKSLACPSNDEAVATGTLRLLGCVLDRGEVHISLVVSLLHVDEESMKGKRMVSTSVNRTIELGAEGLMLVANVLGQVVFPKERLLAGYGTASDERCLVS